MQNPWLEIPASDYEGHMKQAGQHQVLNRLTQYFLDKHKPERFALLGCSAGNGLEHVNDHATKRVVAVDINPDFLELARQRFQLKITGLELRKLDIEQDVLDFGKMDLIFAGLLLEYVDTEIVLPKIVNVLNPGGTVALVIQKNYQAAFVTLTGYKSLEKLSVYSHDVDEDKVCDQLIACGLQPDARKEIRIMPEKSLICLSFQKP